jgi:hypothetical protein
MTTHAPSPDHLEQFYYDMLDGLRPQLALMAPPQHGKTKLLIG